VTYEEEILLRTLVPGQPECRRVLFARAGMGLKRGNRTWAGLRALGLVHQVSRSGYVLTPDGQRLLQEMDAPIEGDL